MSNFELLNEDGLLTALAGGFQVYWSPDSKGWFVTYGKGAASPATVRSLVKKGKVRPVYSNCPNDAFWTGETIDIDRTIADREGKPKTMWRTIYVDRK